MALSRQARIALLTGGVLSVLAAVAFTLLSRAQWDIECKNTLLSETTSPDGERKIVIFERDCGATTGFSTQASLLRPNQTLPAAAGNFYIADDNHGAAVSGPGGGPRLSIEWKSPRSVVITSALDARVLLARPQIDDVQVEYTPTHRSQGDLQGGLAMTLTGG